MKLTVNGEQEQWDEGVTLADLVSRRLRSDRGVAAAVDGAVAPRSGWGQLILQDGQTIELLTAVQGG
jgi:sulfur carrier protein